MILLKENCYQLKNIILHKKGENSMRSKHDFSDIRIPIEKDNPAIMRDESKCIKCGQCRRVCREEIAVGRLYDLVSTGDTAICIHCGQCANVCPVNSITETPEFGMVMQAIADPEKVVIFNTSPSVRVGLGEEFGLEAGSFVEGKMVAALRALGADYVLDTNFSADLTIMEEAAELVERITKKQHLLPQFTSCCPAWVKFVETFYPERLPHISTAKSPIGMQGPTVKTYFAKKNGINPKAIVNVAVTPCTAKKYEIRRPEMNASASYLGEKDLRDMDYVITTRELAKWIRMKGILFQELEESAYDSLMGAASGAGIIFGNTGGVMEAAVRTAYYLITKEEPHQALFQLEPVRGMDGIKEASLEIAGIPVRLAVIHGTENARQFLEEMKEKPEKYDFVEVMTCRGGCIGGGGQPKTEIPMTDEIRNKRITSLYRKEESVPIRTSHQNPEIKAVYEEFYGAPLSELAEKMLHTVYEDKSTSLGEKGMLPAEELETNCVSGMKKWKCKICGHIVEAEELAEDFVCPICKKGREFFEQIAE